MRQLTWFEAWAEKIESRESIAEMILPHNFEKEGKTQKQRFLKEFRCVEIDWQVIWNQRTQGFEPPISKLQTSPEAEAPESRPVL